MEYTTPSTKQNQKTVTPEEDNKHVRFSVQKRGLVSRRGGRFLQQSPGRQQQHRHQHESDVPSLCSTGSGTLLSNNEHKSDVPTQSISLFQQQSEQTTSPLQSEEQEKKKADNHHAVTQRAMTPPPDRKVLPTSSMKSPGIRDYIATPTDFALDYGKLQTTTTANFEHSNVMAWLQSPTAANVMFSPGGYNSLLYTPQRGARTPRTPIVSTSFFFSDVASLPKGEDNANTTTTATTTPKSISRKGNVICISPLNAGKEAATPISAIRDMFGSPGREYNKILSGVPTLNETPDRKVLPIRSNEKPGVEATMTSRELMEDEDLSYLLRVSGGTPNSVRPPVFRSPKKESDDDDNDNLKLPVIGKEKAETDTKKPALEMRMSLKEKESKDSADEKKMESKTKVYPPQPQYPPPPGVDRYYGIHAPPQTAGAMHVMVGGPPPGKAGPPPKQGSPYDYPTAYMQPGMYYPGYPYPYQSHYPPPPPHYPVHPPRGREAVATSTKHVRPKTSLLDEEKPHKKKRSSGAPLPKKKRSSPIMNDADKEKSAHAVKAMNDASGQKNDKAADLAAAALRGVTMRPSGKWQAQLYFAGKSRYIGVFDSREKAALAYEIAREKLKSGSALIGTSNPKATENLVNEARKAAFDGVNEQLK